MKHFPKITTILLCVVFSYCSIKNKSNSNVFRIIKIENLKLYKLITFANNSDTLLGISKRNVSEKCILKHIAAFEAEKIDRVEKLIDKGDTIFFHYDIRKLNGGRTHTGSGAPGQSNKTYIFSYNSYPILLKDCEY